MEYAVPQSSGRMPCKESAFRALSDDAAKRFLAEFVSSIPARLKLLEAAIRSESGNAAWRADLSRESLADLGPWLVATTSRRPLRDDEPVFQWTGPGLPPDRSQDLDSYLRKSMLVFTEESCPRLVDAATYFCECVRSTNSRWNWRVITMKSHSSRGQPALGLDAVSGTEIRPFELGRNVTVFMQENKKPLDEWVLHFDRELLVPDLIPPRPPRKRTRKAK